jgi:hypothetical protein
MAYLAAIRDEDDAVTPAELVFLEEQWEALVELREEGRFTEIVPFARDGLDRASKLECRADAQTCDRATQLTKNYRKLLKTILH